MEPSQNQSSEQEPEKYMPQQQSLDAEKEENEIIEKNVDLVRKSLGENVEETESPLKILSDNVFFSRKILNFKMK